jgi:hypothetical protein
MRRSIEEKVIVPKLPESGRIIALNEKLRRAEAVGGSAQALRAARRQLVLQLAAVALEDDGPLPGADAEYGRAREAQAALERHLHSPIRGV